MGMTARENEQDPNPHLCVSGLSCVRDDRVLFNDLSFEIRSHQMLLLEGRNGSGKTTLLRALCGIRPPDSGEIRWCGTPIEKLGPDYHAHIAYVGHADGVKRELTALENLRMAQTLGKPNTLDLEAGLEQVGLAGFEEVLTLNLSAGQQRRLALARLLITDSQLWILDEPYTSLDKSGIALFGHVMEQHTAKGGMVILTAHHDVQLANADVQRIDLSA